MLKYLKSSEISFRVGLNPFNWKWIPAVAYEAPTPFYPKRRTYAFAFLLLQAFLDVDDGSSDLSSLSNLFGMDNIDVVESNEVGSEISETSKRSLGVE